jgi:DNA-binding transcriptional ArsR family regulator
MENQFVQVAGLIGDPKRATILWTLLNGKALTATELAISADTTPQNVSMHLGKLVASDLLSVQSQGRHKYYSYSRKEIAHAVEVLASLFSPASLQMAKTPENHSPIKYCRTCYDHLAGKIGVMVLDSMIGQGIILQKDRTIVLSKKGITWFAHLGIDVKRLSDQRRSVIRPCLDWSERRHHLAGALAASLLEKMIAEDWIRKAKNSRTAIVTSTGKKQLSKYFDISV